MARSPDILEDSTPLDGAHVDVRVRIAWLLRSWRALGVAGGSVSVTEMAAMLKRRGVQASPPSVSGWETGRVAPSPAVVEAYEAVLGLEPGSLRAVVDLVRRQFGDDRPRSAVQPFVLDDLDAAVDRVVGSSRPTGLAWLHFSEAAVEVHPGLPRAFLRPLVDRLMSEMNRSAFTAYTTRYEALAMLRSSRYADVVADAVADFIDEPGNLLLGDASTLIAQRPDERAVRILAPQLVSTEFLRLRAGVVGLQHVATSGVTDEATWAPAVDPYAEAWDRDPGNETRRAGSSASSGWCCRRACAERSPHASRRPWCSIPSRSRGSPAGSTTSSRSAGAPPTSPRRRSGCPTSRCWPACSSRRSSRRAGDRRTTSALLLMGSPFRANLAVQIGNAAQEQADPDVRRAAAMLLLLVGREESHEAAARLLDSEDVGVVTGALFTLMHSGGEMHTERLESLIRRPEPLDRRAMFYAGMTAHPVLDRVAADPDHPLRQVGAVVAAPRCRGPDLTRAGPTPDSLR